MKCGFSRFLLAGALLGATGSSLTCEAIERSPDPNQLPLVKFVEPQYPWRLRSRGITNGYALVAVTADLTGHVIDVYSTESSDLRFADSAISAISEWVFEPAESEASLPRFFRIRVDYRIEGLVVVLKTADAQTELNDRFGIRRPALESFAFENLDSPPEEIHAPMPSYPETVKAERKTGSVEIQFYVDDTGRVRVPFVSRSDDSRFSEAAMEVFRKWTFSTPTRKGRPVSAFAVQKFTFGPRSSLN